MNKKGFGKTKNFTFPYKHYRFDTLEFEQILIGSRVTEKQIDNAVFKICEAADFFKVQ